jgi:hypothetical protein
MSKQTSRLNLTVSHQMRVALEVLAARTGLGVATQATMMLRQALDRTITTPEVQRRMASHNAQRNHAAWLEETMVDHATEKTFTDCKDSLT